jgi:hypothetical protein
MEVPVTAETILSPIHPSLRFNVLLNLATIQHFESSYHNAEDLTYCQHAFVDHHADGGATHDRKLRR